MKYILFFLISLVFTSSVFAADNNDFNSLNHELLFMQHETSNLSGSEVSDSIVFKDDSSGFYTQNFEYDFTKSLAIRDSAYNMFLGGRKPYTDHEICVKNNKASKLFCIKKVTNDRVDELYLDVFKYQANLDLMKSTPIKSIKLYKDSGFYDYIKVSDFKLSYDDSYAFVVVNPQNITRINLETYKVVTEFKTDAYFDKIKRYKGKDWVIASSKKAQSCYFLIKEEKFTCKDNVIFSDIDGGSKLILGNKTFFGNYDGLYVHDIKTGENIGSIQSESINIEISHTNNDFLPENLVNLNSSGSFGILRTIINKGLFLDIYSSAEMAKVAEVKVSERYEDKDLSSFSLLLNSNGTVLSAHDSLSNTVSIYDVKSTQIIDEIKSEKSISAIQFSNSGKFFAIGYDDGQLDVYQVSGMKRYKINRAGSNTTVDQANISVDSIKFSPEDQFLVVILSVTGRFDKYEKRLRVIDLKGSLNIDRGYYSDTDFSDDDEFVIVSGNSKQIEIFNTKTAKSVYSTNQYSVRYLGKSSEGSIFSWKHSMGVDAFDTKTLESFSVIYDLIGLRAEKILNFSQLFLAPYGGYAAINIISEQEIFGKIVSDLYIVDLEKRTVISKIGNYNKELGSARFSYDSKLVVLNGTTILNIESGTKTEWEFPEKHQSFPSVISYVPTVFPGAGIAINSTGIYDISTSKKIFSYDAETLFWLSGGGLKEIRYFNNLGMIAFRDIIFDIKSRSVIRASIPFDTKFNVTSVPLLQGKKYCKSNGFEICSRLMSRSFALSEPIEGFGDTILKWDEDNKIIFYANENYGSGKVSVHSLENNTVTSPFLQVDTLTDRVSPAGHFIIRKSTRDMMLQRIGVK